MHRTGIQQHFHNLKAAGLSTYQAEAVVRSAAATNIPALFNLDGGSTADLLLFGCTWADMPGSSAALRDPVARKHFVPGQYQAALDKLNVMEGRVFDEDDLLLPEEIEL